MNNISRNQTEGTNSLKDGSMILFNGERQKIVPWSSIIKKELSPGVVAMIFLIENQPSYRTQERQAFRLIAWEYQPLVVGNSPVKEIWDPVTLPNGEMAMKIGIRYWFDTKMIYCKFHLGTHSFVPIPHEDFQVGFIWPTFGITWERSIAFMKSPYMFWWGKYSEWDKGTNTYIEAKVNKETINWIIPFAGQFIIQGAQGMALEQDHRKNKKYTCYISNGVEVTWFFIDGKQVSNIWREALTKKKEGYTQKKVIRIKVGDSWGWYRYEGRFISVSEADIDGGSCCT